MRDVPSPPNDPRSPIAATSFLRNDCVVSLLLHSIIVGGRKLHMLAPAPIAWIAILVLKLQTRLPRNCPIAGGLLLVVNMLLYV